MCRSLVDTPLHDPLFHVDTADRCSLAVIEVGCGQRVPSVRRECEDVVRDTLARGGRATLIRINPEPRTLAAGHAEVGEGGAEEGEAEEGEEARGTPSLPAESVLALPDTALRGLTRILGTRAR